MPTYQVREKMLSIGDDLWIENDAGERVFKVDGKALRVRKTLIFEDTEGRQLCKIQGRSCASATAWRSRTPTAIALRWSRRP
jgi:uncharacterized protein YxjI